MKPVQPLADKYEITVHVDAVRSVVNSVRSSEIYETAQYFLVGLDNLRKMLVLPLGLLVQQSLAPLVVDRFAEMVASFDQDPRTLLKSVEQRDRLLAKATEELMIASRAGDPVINTIVAKGAQDTLCQLLNDADVRESVTSLLLSSISTAWTLFECLAADLWKAAFEGHPSVTTPATKFNFAKIDGAAKAYREVLGTAANTIFDENSRLYLLNKVRNIIVHRGGVVDNAFKMQTLTFPEVSHLAVNNYLNPQSSDASFFTDTIVDAGSRLISIVYEWLSKHPR